MMNVELFQGEKEVPFIHQQIRVKLNGDLIGEDGKILTLFEFNKITALDVNDILVLVAVTYQKINWPPSYWKHLVALKAIPEISSPESVVLGIKSPVESLEYPGFYLIPYFTNYVISSTGRLIKKSTGQEIVASEGALGYYTYRMTDDSNHTQNELRHRILCYAFKPYPSNVEELDVNHIDGCPGSDSLLNLEWATRSANMSHAYSMGLRKDNLPVEMREVATGKCYIFPSCSALGRAIGVTETTVSNRAKALGYKAFDGFQFRFYPNSDPWPEILEECGKYLIEFPDGVKRTCSCNEAARLVGVTRTSLLRLIRDGRHYGTTENKVTRLST